jgi:hypothetical protein
MTIYLAFVLMSLWLFLTADFLCPEFADISDHDLFRFCSDVNRLLNFEAFLCPDFSQTLDIGRSLVMTYF